MTTQAVHFPLLPRSVFLRCALLLAVCTAVVTASLSALSISSSLNAASERVVDEAWQVTTFVGDQAGGAIRFDKPDRLEKLFRDAADAAGGTLLGSVAVDTRGDQVAASGATDIDAAAALAARAVETGEVQRAADGLTLALPVRFGNSGSTVGAVTTVWTDAPLRAEAMADQWTALGASMVVFLVALAAATAFLRQGVTRPLLEVRDAMTRVAARDYGAEVPGTERSDEVGGIARTLDELRTSLAGAEVAAREGLFRGAGFEGSSAAMMMVDRDFNVAHVNAAFRDLVAGRPALARRAGTDPAALTGRDFDVFGALTPSARQRLRDPSQLPVHGEVTVGDTTVSVAVAAVHDDDGTLTGYVVEWGDVTVESANAALLAALDAQQAKAQFAADGRLISANDNFAQLIGRTAGDLHGEPAARLLTAEDSDLREVISAGRSVKDVFSLAIPDGAPAILDGSLTAMRDREGAVTGFLLLASNITEARATAERAAAREREMQAAQARVVETLRQGLERLSDGDLTSTIEDAFPLDYERLRNDFNAAVGRLRQAMTTVLENAQSITNEARDISSASDDLSRRTETQAATLEESVAALDRITGSLKDTTDGARKADQVVRDARENAISSGGVVQQAVDAMSEIESSSDQITTIIKVIDDIAFQTNLLALNAGVEAARAGEAGRGFAVVASEVRALAQRSSEAAREINTLISTSGDHVKRGVTLVGEAGQALERILSSVTDIAQHVTSIANSAEEQSASLDEINVAMQQLDQVTQQNVAMFEETTAASHAMTREAETLNETMSRFRLGAERAKVIPARFGRDTSPVPASAPKRAASGGGGDQDLTGWEDF